MGDTVADCLPRALVREDPAARDWALGTLLAGWQDEYVTPRGTFTSDTYDKPVAVLVGRWTASMGEGVAIGLDAMGRTTVFGSVMAGLQGATYSHTLEHTGISVRVPGERLFHVDGTRREAFVPRMPMESGSSDEDVVVDGALEWLRGQL